MSFDRTKGRRRFEPTLDGLRLESRELLSHAKGTPFTVDQFLLTNPQPGYALGLSKPPQRQGHRAFAFGGGPVYTRGYDRVQTIRGGQGVQVATPDGSHFRLTLQLADTQFDGGLSNQTGGAGTGVIPSNVVQAVGTIRAYPMPGGKVGIIVDGTTENMQLVIDPLPFPQRKGYAHSFAYGQSGREHILNIGSLNVTTGKLNAVLGFHSAELSGPLIIGGSATVDRIALNKILPGGSIGVGGSLNTLDVLNGVALSSGPGISVGRDLNLFNVGGDVTLSNGASIRVGRFIGLNPQPPKGTGTGSNYLALNQSTVGSGSVSTLTPSVSAYIQGNLTIGPGSVLAAPAGIANSSIIGGPIGAPAIFTVNGSITASSATSVQIPNLLAGTGFVRGFSALGAVFNNLVGRTGVNIPGVPVIP